MKSVGENNRAQIEGDDVHNPSGMPRGFAFRTICANWMKRTVHHREGVLASGRQSRAIDTQLSALPKREWAARTGGFTKPEASLKHAEELSHKDCASPLFRTGKGYVILDVRVSSEWA